MRRSQKSTSRWMALLAIAGVATLTLGCGSTSQQLRALIDQNKPAEAVEKGEEFIADHGHKDSVEVTRVERLVAEAALVVAIRKDTVRAYAAMRKRVPLTTASERFLKQAFEREARAWLRDFAKVSNTVVAYQAFRRRYPGTKAAAEGLQLEAKLAFMAAVAAQKMDAIDKFILAYNKWPSLKPLLSSARQQEASLGYQQGVALRSIAFWRRYGDRFAETKWGAKARRAESQLVFEQAVRATGSQQMMAFIQRYERDKLVDPALIGRARAIGAQRIWQTLERSATPEQLLAYIRTYELWPEAAGVVVQARGALASARLALAVQSGTSVAIERWIELHQQWPEAKEQLRRARHALVRAALQEVTKSRDRGALRAFLERFRGWSEAADARVTVMRLLQTR